jgi:hypothetical protein
LFFGKGINIDVIHGGLYPKTARPFLHLSRMPCNIAIPTQTFVDKNPHTRYC